ncbi:uncharacterized protein LOC127284690 [Leptopilina boulardi]|uniref:uncharacterized protein LOC127284690 n=1 Tax=Leptopilina boulardi TaxID=63433 RepID=UPI0021F60E62|nr:uncharacterized protein LOC127284690 [Leptopilina boulardi]
MRNKFYLILFLFYTVLQQKVSTSVIEDCFQDLDEIYSSGYYYDPTIDKCVKFFQHYFKINKKYDSKKNCLQNRDPDYYNRLEETFPSVYFYDKKTGECTGLFYSQFLHTPKNSFSSKELCENTCLG